MICVDPQESFSPINNQQIKSKQLAMLFECINSEVYVTSFDVELHGAYPSLTNERVLNVDEVIQWIQSVQSPTRQLNNEFRLHDERILIDNSYIRMWVFTPSNSDCLYWKLSDEYSFIHPLKWCQFLFIQRANKLHIYAIGKTRPSLDTMLYRAPFPNIYAENNICLGNVAIDRSMSIDEVSYAYFNSIKTHSLGERFIKKMKNHCDYDCYLKWLERKSINQIQMSELIPYRTLRNVVEKFTHKDNSNV
ncbi:hypothetical protein [Vibrio tritonius]|uniref:hypothetical protein n=1 Tax=Vibrio tritonius TaxID=1435069 RepID=UPI00315D8135